MPTLIYDGAISFDPFPVNSPTPHSSTSNSPGPLPPPFIFPIIFSHNLSHNLPCKNGHARRLWQRLCERLCHLPTTLPTQRAVHSLIPLPPTPCDTRHPTRDTPHAVHSSTTFAVPLCAAAHVPSGRWNLLCTPHGHRLAPPGGSGQSPGWGSWPARTKSVQPVWSAAPRALRRPRAILGPSIPLPLAAYPFPLAASHLPLPTFHIPCGRAAEPSLPEPSPSALPLIVLPGGAPRRRLDHGADRLPGMGVNDNVHVVGGDAVSQHGDAVPQGTLPQPSAVGCAVPLQSQQKLPVLAPVGEVVGIPGNYDSVSSWHDHLKSYVQRLDRREERESVRRPTPP